MEVSVAKRTYSRRTPEMVSSPKLYAGAVIAFPPLAYVYMLLHCTTAREHDQLGLRQNRATPKRCFEKARNLLLQLALIAFDNHEIVSMVRQDVARQLRVARVRHLRYHLHQAGMLPLVYRVAPLHLVMTKVPYSMDS